MVGDERGGRHEVVAPQVPLALVACRAAGTAEPVQRCRGQSEADEQSTPLSTSLSTSTAGSHTVTILMTRVRVIKQRGMVRPTSREGRRSVPILVRLRGRPFRRGGRRREGVPR